MKAVRGILLPLHDGCAGVWVCCAGDEDYVYMISEVLGAAMLRLKAPLFFPSPNWERLCGTYQFMLNEVAGRKVTQKCIFHSVGVLTIATHTTSLCWVEIGNAYKPCNPGGGGQECRPGTAGSTRKGASCRKRMIALHDAGRDKRNVRTQDRGI